MKPSKNYPVAIVCVALIFAATALVIAGHGAELLSISGLIFVLVVFAFF